MHPDFYRGSQSVSSSPQQSPSCPTSPFRSPLSVMTHSPGPNSVTLYAAQPYPSPSSSGHDRSFSPSTSPKSVFRRPVGRPRSRSSNPATPQPTDSTYLKPHSPFADSPQPGFHPYASSPSPHMQPYYSEPPLPSIGSIMSPLRTYSKYQSSAPMSPVRPKSTYSFGSINPPASPGVIRSTNSHYSPSSPFQHMTCPSPSSSGYWSSNSLSEREAPSVPMEYAPSPPKWSPLSRHSGLSPPSHLSYSSPPTPTSLSSRQSPVSSQQSPSQISPYNQPLYSSHTSQQHLVSQEARMSPVHNQQLFHSPQVSQSQHNQIAQDFRQARSLASSQSPLSYHSQQSRQSPLPTQPLSPRQSPLKSHQPPLSPHSRQSPLPSFQNIRRTPDIAHFPWGDSSLPGLPGFAQDQSKPESHNHASSYQSQLSPSNVSPRFQQEYQKDRMTLNNSYCQSETPADSPSKMVSLSSNSHFSNCVKNRRPNRPFLWPNAILLRQSGVLVV